MRVKTVRASPSVKAIAREVGTGARMVQKHLGMLERGGFIRRLPRFDGTTQKSNWFEFLWHSIYELRLHR